MMVLGVFLAGIFAGFVNILAGGGSFLTLPVLTYSGLGLDVANGTNRLAIFLQNVVAVYKFKKGKRLKWKKAFGIALPILIGAVWGSLIAVNLPKDLLKRIVGILLIVVFFFMYKSRDKIIVSRRVNCSWIVKYLAYVAVGIYGGFIQAGVGFFLIYTITTFEGTDIVETNAYKVFSVLLYSLPVIGIFIMSGNFSLIYGLILSAGNMTGAYVGTKMALVKGAKWVRNIVFVAMITSGVLFITGI